MLTVKEKNLIVDRPLESNASSVDNLWSDQESTFAFITFVWSLDQDMIRVEFHPVEKTERKWRVHHVLEARSTRSRQRDS